MAINNSRTGTLSVTWYNMHGFQQGAPTVDSLIAESSPDIFMLLQEHWLTPTNLCLFDKHFDSYFVYGSSVLSHCIDSGMLRGRPYGGVMILINKNLRPTQTIHCAERYVVVKVRNKLLVNVYFPCQGMHDRVTLCEELLTQISSWCEQYNDCEIVFAGDLNCNLDSGDPVSYCVKQFVDRFSLSRGDVLFSCSGTATYVNVTLNHQSCTDYVLISSHSSLLEFSILDPDVNFSDHLPLIAIVTLRDCTGRGNARVDSGKQNRPILNTQYGTKLMALLIIVKLGSS